MGKNEINVVYVYNIVEKKEYLVIDKWYNFFFLVFSVDGKYLIFFFVCDFNLIYGLLEWNYVYNNMYGVYIVLLFKDILFFFMQKDVEVVVLNVIFKSGDKKLVDKKEVVDVLLVKFDLDGIIDCIVCLFLFLFYYGNFYFDGNKVYYWGCGGMKMYDLVSQKEELIVDGVLMDVIYDGKKVFFFKGC